MCLVALVVKGACLVPKTSVCYTRLWVIIYTCQKSNPCLLQEQLVALQIGLDTSPLSLTYQIFVKLKVINKVTFKWKTNFCHYYLRFLFSHKQSIYAVLGFFMFIFEWYYSLSTVLLGRGNHTSLYYD